jgi:hypothetical protein
MNLEHLLALVLIIVNPSCHTFLGSYVWFIYLNPESSILKKSLCAHFVGFSGEQIFVFDVKTEFYHFAVLKSGGGSSS